MRTDILPLCDKHYRTMEACIAPFSADYSIEFFRCTAQFCHRCFSERLGYVTRSMVNRVTHDAVSILSSNPSALRVHRVRRNNEPSNFRLKNEPHPVKEVAAD